APGQCRVAHLIDKASWIGERRPRRHRQRGRRRDRQRKPDPGRAQCPPELQAVVADPEHPLPPSPSAYPKLPLPIPGRKRPPVGDTFAAVELPPGPSISTCAATSLEDRPLRPKTR